MCRDRALSYYLIVICEINKRLEFILISTSIYGTDGILIKSFFIALLYFDFLTHYVFILTTGYDNMA